MSVLFNGSIKQQFASSLAAAVLLSAAGATITDAQPLSESPSESPDSFSSGDLLEEQLALSPNAPSETEAVASSAIQPAVQPASELAPVLSNDIFVYAHEIDGRQAATLYVKEIPVLTFIGTEVDSLSNASDAVSLAASDTLLNIKTEAAPTGDILNASLESDPVLRANNLGSQLDPETVDAESLSVRWQEETDGYVITLADEDLIALDSRTILADTTADPAEDALQATNRLRRLLGDADPVSEIEGLPEPEPVVEVAPAQTVAIVSSNVGGASWYGPGFDGRLSASGETFNQYALTAAHRTLPFGTHVLVTNLYNGRQVTVRINDRGPYSGDRIIDLSAGAAAEIGLIDSGVGTVQIDVLAN
ncbi:MAG: septal ring lytic transglycosylase RlpA family protein [Phormidesmis sp.]